MNELHFGVCVGINRYPDFTDLSLARRDAEKFAEWLLDPDGGALDPGTGPVDSHVKCVLAPSPDLPPGTKRRNAVPFAKQVLDAISDFADMAKEAVDQKTTNWYRTRLYIYFSGHGIASTVDDALALLANAGPEYYNEHLSCSEVAKELGEIKWFRELVIFADCCRQRSDHAKPRGGTWTVKPWKHLKNVNIMRAYATYFGDVAREPPPESITDPDTQRGYFTQALLEGLRSEGQDEKKPGLIDSNSLAKYVKARVKLLTKDNPQVPAFQFDPTEPIVFRPATAPPAAPLAPPPAAPPVLTEHSVSIRFPPSPVPPVRLEDGGHALVAEHVPNGAPWQLKLSNGYYRVLLSDGSVGEFRDGGFFEVRGGACEVQL